jgi:hypothetical protein
MLPDVIRVFEVPVPDPKRLLQAYTGQKIAPGCHSYGFNKLQGRFADARRPNRGGKQLPIVVISEKLAAWRNC